MKVKIIPVSAIRKQKSYVLKERELQMEKKPHYLRSRYCAFHYHSTHMIRSRRQMVGLNMK